jgi:hypothetical protein
MEKIEITINPQTGEVNFEVFGVNGKSCVDLTAGLEEAFNGKVLTKRSFKASYQPKTKGRKINESLQQSKTKNKQ